MKRFSTGSLAVQKTKKPEAESPELKFQRLAVAAGDLVRAEIYCAKSDDQRAVLVRLEEAFTAAIMAGIEALPPGPPVTRKGYLCVVISPTQQKELRVLANCCGMSLQVFIWRAIHHYAESVESALGVTGGQALEMTREERRALGEKCLRAMAALSSIGSQVIKRN